MHLRTRLHWEEHERQSLAPYAQLSGESRGRVHNESVHVFRSEYQRDRDRIVHSTAFRRLEYKTQVVLNSTGDHFRTRLTHTMEVTALSRTLARTLLLNEELSEAVALAHDLGHPPFGHPGEHTLNQLMQDHDGFEHNTQSLRVVTELEMKYPEFNGLNLTHEVLDGLSKKNRPAPDILPCLEAQIADLADEIAYCSHDLDDALENGLITEEQMRAFELWKELEDSISRQYSRLDFDRKRKFLIRCLIDLLIEDVCKQSAKNIEESGIKTAAEARQCGRRLVAFSLPVRARVQNLRDFLLQHFYYHPSVSGINQKACQVLQALFQFYHAHPQQIGDKTALRIKKEGVSRCVCDYVSGMTDRYALSMYARHIGTDSLLQELMPK